MSINEQIGLQVVEWFKLKKNKKGRYDTAHGDKSLEGLGASIKRIIKDAEDKARRDALGKMDPIPKND